MKLSKVLLSHKRTTYQLYVEQGLTHRMKKMFKDRHAIANDMAHAHETHIESIARVKAILRKHGISYDVRGRNTLHKLERYDLAISIGGDGTFLRTAHFIRAHPPLLGVNSSPNHSVGALCSIHADTFEDKLLAILEDRVRFDHWTRLVCTLNGKVLPELILNDAFVGNHCPAAASRYFIVKGQRCEEQRSSGLWIAAPTGSTAALAAAGGRPIGARRTRAFEYLVREPYTMPARAPYRLTKGRLKTGESLSITSQMGDGAIYIDGPRVHYPFNFGDEVSFQLSDHPLKVVV